MIDDNLICKLPVRFREAVLQEILKRDEKNNIEKNNISRGGRSNEGEMRENSGDCSAGPEEIRFRIGHPLELCFSDANVYLTAHGKSDTVNMTCRDVIADTNDVMGVGIMADAGDVMGMGVMADTGDVMGMGAVADRDIVTGGDVRELLNYLTGYSIYAYEDEIRQGYFTIQGGHRVGVVGRASETWESGIPDISAVNIRIAHEHKGCARPLMPYIFRSCENKDNYGCKAKDGRESKDSREAEDRCGAKDSSGNKMNNSGIFCSWNKHQLDIYNTLIVAQPGVGKTTYLRDCIRILSQSFKVCVVDERSEIAACYKGVPQNDVGPRTDVLDNCPKQRGMRMLLRSMSPQIIAVDELAGEEDFQALYEIIHSGIRILGTIHAAGINEVLAKPFLRKLIEQKMIERCILLEKDLNGRRNYKVFSDILENHDVCESEAIYNQWSDDANKHQ